MSNPLKQAFVDLSCNQPKDDKTRAESHRIMLEQFEERLPEAVERIWELPPIIVQIGDYVELLKEARELFVFGYFYSCVAMCGIVGERLVKDVFRSSVLVQREGQDPASPTDAAFNQLEHVDVRGIVNFLNEAGLLDDAAKKAAVELGELRNRYAHARGKEPHVDASKAIKMLHRLVEGTVSMMDFEIRGGSFVRKTHIPAQK